MDKDNSKDIAKSLNKYTDYAHKGTNLVLNSAESINKWYATQLDKITECDTDVSRIETGVDNTIESNNISEKKIFTKVKQYNEIQTNQGNNKKGVEKVNKIQTTSKNDKENVLEKQTEKLRLSKKISTAIKGAKTINNTTQRMIKTGKDISTGLNENGTTAFQESSTRIMTKPIRKAFNKATNKITNKTAKSTKKFAKKIYTKVNKKNTQKVKQETISKANNVMIKVVKLISKLMAKVGEMVISMLPQIAPVLIIIIIIATFCNFFGIGMSEDTKKSYEKYMINTQKSYDQVTVAFYNTGKIVDGTIEGKGMIDWRAPLSILQMLNGELTFDSTETSILEKFKDAGLYEQIRDKTYSYEKETDKVDERGNKIKETITDTKKVVKNPTLNDYITWCNNNFDVINEYKTNKGLDVDKNQKAFSNNEIEQIKMLYSSNSFFELFSSEFKTTYAYLNVNIGDEQLKAIYEEFLKNVGKRYLMDHSNLKYDECMDYYDCSSWVIHCLAHTGIITITNTGAQGIYNGYCYPVDANDRKAGDLIFLKDTYDTGVPGSISHIGIYMGTLTIDGVTDEWVIDTGGNPSGVRIRKYNNGWWNGTNFYGFGRLKGN